MIEDKDVGGLVPFTLWDFQQEIIDKLCEVDRVIVLKARQLGITWLTLAFYLYDATFFPNRLILLASKREDEGKEMLRRVRIMHSTLPPQWKTAAAVGDDNKLSMSFTNGSRFVVLPATATMARSYSAYAAVIDEMAFMPYQSEMWSAIEPAAKRISCISTGYRKADVFYDMWTDAVSGKSEFEPIFLPWTVHPKRDKDWYTIHVENSLRPRLARREYCSNPEEAFTSAEGLFFENYSPKTHVLKQWYSPTVYWPTWRMVDFGYRHGACLWLQKSPDNQIFIYHELCPVNLTTTQFAEKIKEFDIQYELETGVIPLGTFCDPAGYSKNTQTAISDIEIFASHGLNPVAQTSSFRDGCILINEVLMSRKPIQIASDCSELQLSFETLEPDKNNLEVYAKDVDFGHVMDALRYGIFNISRIGGKLEVPSAENLLAAQPVTAGLFNKIY
jgi:hypothetical protein